MMTSLQRITLVLFCFFLNLAASQTKQIKLKLTSNPDTFNLNEYQSDLRPLSYTDNFIGIPELDSLKFHFVAMDYVQYAYDMYKDNKLEKTRALAYFKRLKIDTLALSHKKINQELIVLIGFKKNKQVLIADTNKNKDFSDEIKYEYNILPNADEALIKNYLPSIYKFEYFENKKIIKFERKFVLIPDKENEVSQKIDKKDIPYLSFLKFVDAWVGEADGYEFYFSDFYAKSKFYVKDKNTNFSKDFVFNKQFKYSFNDTIAVNNSNYTIKRQLKMDSLFLNSVKKGYVERFTTGNMIPLNYTFRDLYYNNFVLKDALKDKDFLLFEFWGTWCGPCVKFYPHIREFYDTNEKKINILGVAVDNSNEEVLEYVKKNNVKWQQVFMKLNDSNTFITQLNIQAYPTIVLIDKKGQITFVGAGDSLSLGLIGKIIAK